MRGRTLLREGLVVGLRRNSDRFLRWWQHGSPVGHDVKISEIDSSTL